MQEFNSLSKSNNLHWYVLRVTYQRELMARAILKELRINCFVPTQNICSIDKKGKRITKEVATIHNYIFVHSCKEQIDDIKRTKIPWLRYVMIYEKDCEKKIMTVPDKQMNHFISVAGNDENETTYICPDEVSLSKGDYVRILGGPFEGIEGIYMKVSNKKQRCVVIKINGIAAVATAAIPRILVEKINTQIIH